MTSIGNDIVDLKRTDIPRTCKPQFYSKIISPAERQLYTDNFSIPLHYFVWLLWSLKESAYKCLQRHQPDLVFSPIKIEVRRINCSALMPATFNINVENTGFNELECCKSMIIFDEIKLYGRSVIFGDRLIHSVVLQENNFENVNWGIKKTGPIDPEYQSTAVRKFLLKRFTRLFPCKISNISKNKAGVPYLIVNGQETYTPVSLSHHGDFVSYSWDGSI